MAWVRSRIALALVVASLVLRDVLAGGAVPSRTPEVWAPLISFKTPKTNAWSVSVSPDAKLVACGAAGSLPNTGALWVWHAGTGEVAYSLDTPRTVRAVAFAPDGKTLATAEHDGNARLRDAANGAVLRTFEGHKSLIDTVSFSPDGKILATSSWDKTVKLWDTATGAHVRTLVGNNSKVFAGAFGKGNVAASGSVDSSARIWRGESEKPAFVLKGHKGSIHWLAFSPDGATLATASWDKTLKLWDTSTGKESATLYGHTDKVLAVAYSADGRTLASSSGSWADAAVSSTVPSPSEVIVWDAATHKIRARLPHPDRVLGVAFAADGTLATAAWNGEVTLWKREPAKEGTPAKADAKEGPAPKKQYPQEYKRSLKGGDRAGLLLYGPAADQCVKFEPDGLRVTLPAGYPGQRPGTGLSTEFGVKGDFEITARFELLQEPAPEEAGQRTEFVVMVTPRESSPPDVWLKANQNRASLSRQAAGKGNLSRYLTTSTTWMKGPKATKDASDQKEYMTTKHFPTGAKSGRLRLARAGAVLFHYTAEGDADDFTLLHEAEFGEKDLKSVRILAATGGPEAALDVRVTDLHIRADSFTTAPGAPSPAAQPRQESDLPIVVIAVASGLLLCGALLWVWQRHRSTPALVHTPSEGVSLIVVPCEGCGKNLKVRKQLAGKRVKCPHCGAAMIVPEPPPGPS